MFFRPVVHCTPIIHNALVSFGMASIPSSARMPFYCVCIGNNSVFCIRLEEVSQHFAIGRKGTFALMLSDFGLHEIEVFTNLVARRFLKTCRMHNLASSFTSFLPHASVNADTNQKLAIDWNQLNFCGIICFLGTHLNVCSIIYLFCHIDSIWHYLRKSLPEAMADKKDT